MSPSSRPCLFGHLVSASGQRLAQIDAAAYPPSTWRPGDLVVSHFGLPPDGPRVLAGMYAYPSLAPVPVLDASGSPAGEFIEFPR